MEIRLTNGIFKTPYNNVTTANNDLKPLIRIIKTTQRKMPNGSVTFANAPYWDTTNRYLSNPIEATN
jgi:hypothetical protein